MTLTAPGQEKKYPCFIHNDWYFITIEKIYEGRDLFCEVYVPQQQHKDHPVVITINAVTKEIMGGYLRFGFGKIKNYIIEQLKYNGGLNSKDDGNRNTYTHVDIITQVMSQSMGWTNSYKMRRYFAMDHIKPKVDLNTLPTPSKVNIKNLQAGVFHERYKWEVEWNSKLNVDFFYYFIDAPHGFKTRNTTHHERECSYPCNFYDQPTGMAVQHPLLEDIDVFTVQHMGYAHSPFYSGDANYELFFIHKHEIISYYKGSLETKVIKAKATLQSLEKEIKTGGSTVYQLMVYYSYPFFGNAAWLRIMIPSSFPNILDCRVSFGLTKLEIDKLDSGDTKCITDNGPIAVVDPVTSVSKNYRKMEVYDIQHFSTFEFNAYENIFLFLVELENPANQGWTEEILIDWYYDPNKTFIYSVNQFSSPTLDTDFTGYSLSTALKARRQIEATNADKQGKYWVGEGVDSLHFVDVQTNRESYQDRKVGLNSFFELDMQFVPKNNFASGQSALAEVGLPLSFHFPVGGSFTCSFGQSNRDQYLQCKKFEISDRHSVKFFKDETQDQISAGKCYIIKMNTSRSIEKRNEQGFKTFSGDHVDPSTQFSISLSDSEVESSNIIKEHVEVAADIKRFQLEKGNDVFMTTSSNEVGKRSVLKIRFKAKKKIEKGMDLGFYFGRSSYMNYWEQSNWRKLQPTQDFFQFNYQANKIRERYIH